MSRSEINLSTRAYPVRSRTEATAQTRRQVLDAVRDLLNEGRFHLATMEEIAQRAGLSRAGLYLHFRSRPALIDAICETLEDSDELRSMHDLVGSGDPRRSLRRVIELNTRFWSSDEAMFRHLYGLAEIDESARDFVARQTEDRRRGVTILASRLRRAGQLRPGLREPDAVAQLLVITSFQTFLELRHTAGLSERGVVRTLNEITEQAVLAR